MTRDFPLENLTPNSHQKHVLLYFTAKRQNDESASTQFSLAVKQKSKFHFKSDTIRNKTEVYFKYLHFVRYQEFSLELFFLSYT